MLEKRRHRRLPIKLTLEVSNLFKQDNQVIENLDAEIEVFDISKSGIGFMTTSKFPLDYYFNATIEFEENNSRVLTVVKIVHQEAIADAGYKYGCEFVGLAGIFDYLFEAYEEAIDKDM